jgi:Predicted Zn-dependent hydrolases of the beta-lactamase fold
MYKVIATGSTGNAVLYHGSILVDCGVSFSALKPYMRDIQIVLLTHQHGDHININTLKALQGERPTLRIGCCKWMLPFIEGLKNIDAYEVGQVYDYGTFSISAIQLYHDVENCGYRIFKDGTKIFHSTDTAHLDGITAKGYDLYAIEHNYDEDTIQEVIERQEAIGVFAHQKGSINSHLSEQQARDFIFNNRGKNSEVVRLHETKSI